MELKLNIGNNNGNRIYSREFLLSQCDQIRRGEIRVQPGQQHALMFIKIICVGEEREVGSD